MIEKVITGLFFLIGIINVLPILAFFDLSKTVSLYGVAVTDDKLGVLMRHRGVLLAIVGACLIYAAVKPEFRLFAVGVALASKLVFIYLTFSGSDPGAEIRQVALIDVGAVVLLVAAVAYEWFAK